jgi:hypothetical protein
MTAGNGNGGRDLTSGPPYPRHTRGEDKRMNGFPLFSHRNEFFADVKFTRRQGCAR